MGGGKKNRQIGEGAEARDKEKAQGTQGLQDNELTQFMKWIVGNLCFCKNDSCAF